MKFKKNNLLLIIVDVSASNRDEGSYQLSHIYDILFALKLSGERRLDRPFRRRLQSKPKRQQ